MLLSELNKFCVGIPGSPPHKATDLVGGLCDECIEKLTSATPWGSAAPNVHKNQGKGPGIIVNAEKQMGTQ